MSEHRTTTIGLVVVALLTALVLTACGEDEGGGGGGQEDAAVWPGDAGVATEEVDLGAGFVAELPQGWVVQQTFDVPDDGIIAPECDSISASIESNGVFVPLSLPGSACAGAETTPLNGEHGDYLTIDDVADPREVEDGEVPLGGLTTFVQSYEECTNECVTNDERVALIELDEIVEPDRPVLMIVVRADEASQAQLTALAESITRSA